MRLVKEINMFFDRYRAILKDNNNTNWFFKELNNAEIFRELLAQEIATIIELNHVSVIPYVFKKRKGILSQSFIKEGNNYISGDDLLNTYFAETESDNQELLYDRTTFYGTTVLKCRQDLYVVWQAMEAKFKNYPNYQEQIKKFMNDLINMIMFDLITVDNDRHSNNWIIEYDDKSFRLSPIFDKDGSFTDKSYSKFNTTQEIITNEKALELLIKESDESIYEVFVNFLKLINSDNIKTIVDNTIIKYNFPISDELRESIIDDFITNYERLKEVINPKEKEEEPSPIK